MITPHALAPCWLGDCLFCRGGCVRAWGWLQVRHILGTLRTASLAVQRAHLPFVSPLCLQFLAGRLAASTPPCPRSDPGVAWPARRAPGAAAPTTTTVQCLSPHRLPCARHLPRRWASWTAFGWPHAASCTRSAR